MISSIESSNTYRNVILQGTYYYNEIIFCSRKGGYFSFLYAPGVIPLCFLNSFERWLSSLNCNS